MNLEQMKARFAELHKTATAHVQAGELEKYEEVKASMDTLEKQIKALEALGDAPDLRQGLPISGGGGDSDPTPDETKAAMMKDIHVLRYGDVDGAQDLIMREAYSEVGGNYLKAIFDQDESYKFYLRTGLRRGSNAQRQLWSIEDVKDMLKFGLSMAEVKATMVEGTDILGGHAVPPQRARDVLREAVGMTAVRNAGARVIVTSSNSIEWLKVTGATKGSYPSGLTGAFGGETQSPTGKNFAVGLQTIPVHLYTYKVALSASLLEDATNIVPILNELMADTMSIDEDTEFLTGTGENAPYGILPGNAPDANGLTVPSANVLTSSTSASFSYTDLKSVRRKIATRYRMRGRSAYVFSADTADHIETMQDGQGLDYFTTVGNEGDMIFRARSYESEAMPDRASSAYPVIYGDFSGYGIVERLGLSIIRFMDSNTGINKVEFHLRRRIGGAVLEPYRFAALRCGA